MEDIYLSVVIPAYNEEHRIGKSLCLITEYLDKKNFNWEIIVVNDGSKDKTKNVVEKFIEKHNNIFLIENTENGGKGDSVKKGVLNTRGKVILFSDADLSTPIKELDKLSIYLECGYDVVIGSRGLKNSKIVIPQFWIRQTMGKIFNLIVRLLLLPGVKDTQCGFKLFEKSVAKIIFSKLRIRGFAFDVEILYKAKKLKYKIKEVPIEWRNSPESKVHPIIDSLHMLFDIIRLKFREREVFRLTNRS